VAELARDAVPLEDPPAEMPTGGDRPTVEASERRESTMGLGDKIENKLEEAKGSAKENVGDATGDRSLQAEGRADQADAEVSQAGEHLKDAAKDVKDAFTS
jgi:uncharacterized protein YjbJ (UPF0337 family)